MCKVNSDQDQNVDYIYVIRNAALKAVKANFKPLEVTETTVECNLDQRQRSSQQILDLIDYLERHHSLTSGPTRKFESESSFCSDIPLWIKLTNPKSFFDCFKNKFECNDVMLIHSNRGPLNDIEEFCRQNNWRCANKTNVRGSEASVTILYDLHFFEYEDFTRAKTQLVIVTIGEEEDRYFNFRVVLPAKLNSFSF